VYPGTRVRDPEMSWVPDCSIPVQYAVATAA
jgi:hypothetical protein